ncbi:hypothetical protein HAX54_024665 [Datura stramonium]|uniref:F-box domain-containing protein n=1 Tax=Datura stramonium TaxID=4076 RepID=A0ABS8RHZ1_DATST|nr:hypothetical protein [Datura stramonium]
MPAKGKGKGKKRGKGNSNNRDPDDPIPNYKILPFIPDILSLLPVKSLLRFKCVCKQWRNLISKPDFVATHYAHSSALQRKVNSSVIIQTRHEESSDHAVLLYKFPKSFVELENPFPFFFPGMSIVGPANGILCLFQPPWGDVITLWNPAMKMSRMVKLSKTKPVENVHVIVSIGLAFDSEKNDLLILRIFCVGSKSTVPNHVEIRSMKNALGWDELKTNLDFYIVDCTCDAIIKGVPYWLAHITDPLYGLREALVRFDVGKMEFEILPMPEYIADGSKKKYLANFEDSPGMLIWEEKDGCLVHVWLMDELEGWRKRRSIGPLFGFTTILSCLWNGYIVVEGNDGMPILFDPVAYSIKARFNVVNNKKGSYFIFECPESLFQIEGMVTVKMPTARESTRKRMLRECDPYFMR